MYLFSNLSKSPNKKWWILLAMSLSLGMTFIDQGAVAVALPKLQTVFNLNSDFLPWVVNAYLLAFAVFLIPGGHLGTIFKVHRVFFTGLGIFFLASIACALSQDIHSLILFRALQGLGAGLILPNANTIIINTFPVNERGKAMGIYVGSSLLFLPLALILGGVFTEYVSWRLIFWLNFPLCILCVLILYSTIENKQEEKTNETINWLDSLLLITSISILVFAVMESSNLGWNSGTLKILLTTSVLLFIVYCFLEKRSRNPIIDFKLFTSRTYLSAAFVTFFISISLGLFIFEAIYYQQVLDYQPAIASLLFFPSIIGIVISAPISGMIFDKYGYRFSIICGLLITFTGLALNAEFVLWQSYLYLLPGTVLINIGTAFILSASETASLSDVEPNQRSIASGVLHAINQISGCINLAVLTAIIFIYNNRLLEKFYVQNKDSYPDLSLSEFKKLLSHPQSSTTIEGVDQQQLTQLYQTAKASYSSAFGLAFMICAGFALIALLSVIFLLKKQKKHTIKKI